MWVEHGVGASAATDLAMRNPEPPLVGGVALIVCYATVLLTQIYIHKIMDHFNQFLVILTVHFSNILKLPYRTDAVTWITSVHPMATRGSILKI